MGSLLYVCGLCEGFDHSTQWRYPTGPWIPSDGMTYLVVHFVQYAYVLDADMTPAVIASTRLWYIQTHETDTLPGPLLPRELCSGVVLMVE